MKLETKRLLLREWKKKDLNDLVEGLNHLQVSKWLVFVPYPYTKKEGEKWITNCIKTAKQKKNDSYNFAIELKSEKKVIGGTNLLKINKDQGVASGGGIWINAKYHGKGYGTEAFNERIKFAFNKLKLRRLENGFFKGNTSSCNMQKRLGYKIEGMRRKAFKCTADGKIKDEYITSLLKEEWKKRIIV